MARSRASQASGANTDPGSDSRRIARSHTHRSHGDRAHVASDELGHRELHHVKGHYWSKYEFGWHWSPTANQHDAIAAVEIALTEADRLLGDVPPLEQLTDPDTGRIVPITLVADNGGPFRSFRFGALIAARPELRHVRTRVRTPGPNGVRERAFRSLKHERLYREPIDDALDLVCEGEAFRVEFNEIRPHEHLAWNRPRDVHLGHADPTIPTFERDQILPTT